MKTFCFNIGPDYVSSVEPTFAMVALFRATQRVAIHAVRQKRTSFHPRLSRYKCCIVAFLIVKSVVLWAVDVPISGSSPRNPMTLLLYPLDFPQSAPPAAHVPLTPIPPSHVCRTTGKPFRPEVVIPNSNRMAASLAKLFVRKPYSDLLPAIEASNVANPSVPGGSVP